MSTAVEKRELALGSVAALGVVYGDIGTSPIYALNQALLGPHNVGHLHDDVLGVLSLVFWAMTLVVSVKYLIFVLRADNNGEGGILALAALVASRRRDGSAAPSVQQRLGVPILLALFGAGLMVGDGIITPAISVLGAVEGLEVASASMAPLVVPVTVAVLVGLFAIQRVGSGRIGPIFGRVMLVWFFAIAALGVAQIVRYPSVFAAVWPGHAVEFFAAHQGKGFLVLGIVVLCITGAEALYAGVGHFGKRPIRAAWFAVVFPCVLLSYFGQGAYLLAHEGAPIEHAFFAMVPEALLWPMIVLAIIAAVIASQALISGVFSLTHQAVQLGFWPRVTVIHMSDRTAGQIYVPEMSHALLVACVALVVGFGSTTALASAYGVAVTGTMVITSILFYAVARQSFGWSGGRAAGLVGLFLLIDGAFFAANLTKVADGGWFPLAVGLAVYTVMTTWWRGRLTLQTTVSGAAIPEELFLLDIEMTQPQRVSGTAVFMASATSGIPNVLLHHFKHNKALHEQVILLSIITERVPWVPSADEITVHTMEHGFFRIVARVGFMQTPRVPRILARCADTIRWEEPATTYYLGRETLLTTGKAKMARWRKVLFSFLSRNARTPAAFYALPPNRVVELGLQVEL